MRTTINLDDAVFRAYKELAVANGTTFAHEIESALRAHMAARHASSAASPRFTMRVFDGGASALIDVNDNRAVQDLLDDDTTYRPSSRP